MRINKFLAESGVCSRRAADQLITEKRVKVNKNIAKIGQEVGVNDIVYVDGRPVNAVKKYDYYIYALLNKISLTLVLLSLITRHLF